MYKAKASVATEGKKVNPNFKVRLNRGIQEDLAMWVKFLTKPSFAQHREIPFTTFLEGSDSGPLIYADSAGCVTKGFGCVFPEKGLWTFGSWPGGFFAQKKPNIMLLELYTIVTAVDTWAPLLKHKQIRLHSDQYEHSVRNSARRVHAS